MSTSVGYAVLQIVPSTKGFAAALTGSVATPMAAAGASGGKAGGAAAGAGLLAGLKGFAAPMAAVMGGIGVANLIGDSIQLEAQFSQTLNTMAAVAGVPAAELDNLSRLALKMGADTSFSANQAADAMLELAKGGISAADISAGALAGTLTLAAAGGTDLATAATIASNAMNTFALEGKDMAAVAAALAGGANASTASVESLGEALSQVGPGATNAGLSLQETIAVLAAFDSAGIKGSDAGTSLKTMLTRLVPATAAAREEMQRLGLKFTDAAGSFLPITDVAEQLHSKLSGLSEEQKTLTLQTLFGADAQRAATVLMNEGAEGIAKYITATSDLNAAQAVADARMAGTAGALERMGGAIETAKLAFGRLIAPAVVAGAEALANTFGWIADALASISGDGIRDYINTISPLQAVLNGPGGVVGGLADIGKAFAVLGEDDGAQGFAELMDHAFGNTGSLVAPMRDFAGGLLSIKDAAVDLWERAKTSLVPLIERVRDDLTPLFEHLRPVVGEVFGGLGRAFTALSEVVGPAFDLLMGWWSWLWSVFGPTIVSVLGHVFDAIAGIVRGAFDVIVGIFHILAGLFTGDWSKVWEGVKEVFGGVWEAIVAVLGAALGIIWDLLVRIFSGLIDWIKSAWQGVADWFADLWHGMTNAASAAWDGIKATWSTVVDFFAGIWDAVKRKAAEAWDGLTSGFRSVRDTLAGYVDAVVGFFTSIPDRIGDLGAKIGDLLISGIKALWNNTVGGFGFDVPSWVPGVGGKSFRIPMLAEGAIVNKATLAMIGEAGPEAVIPLSKLDAILNGRGSGDKILNYYAAPGTSLSAEDDLFAAAGRARMAW